MEVSALDGPFGVLAPGVGGVVELLVGGDGVGGHDAGPEGAGLPGDGIFIPVGVNLVVHHLEHPVVNLGGIKKIGGIGGRRRDGRQRRLRKGAAGHEEQRRGEDDDGDEVEVSVHDADSRNVATGCRPATPAVTSCQ